MFMTWKPQPPLPFSSTNKVIVCIGLRTYSVKPRKCTGLRELTCVILATLLHGPAHSSPTCENILHLLTPGIC